MLNLKEKIEELLYVNINYKSGLYTFDNPTVFEDIPEEIVVNVPFYYSENSFEELAETIGYEDDKYIYIPLKKGIGNLAKNLAKVLMEEYDKIVFLQEESVAAKGYLNDNAGIIVISSGNQLLNPTGIKEAGEDDVLKELSSIPADVDEGYNSAMQNGFIAMMTGNYPPGLDNTLAKHVLLKDNNLKNINDYVDMNGAVVCENEKSIDKEAIQHIHTMTDKELFIDSKIEGSKHHICTYAEYVELRENNQLSEQITYYLKIENKKDLNAFSNDLDEYLKTGLVDIYDKKIVDACRWTGNCSLKQLKRYKIANNKIYPCFTSDVSIGSVDMDREQRIIEASRIYDKGLSMVSGAAKCACLPAGISRQEYISFMENYPMISDYILQNQLTSYMKRNGHTCRKVRSVRFSTGDRRLIYPKSCVNRKSINVFNDGDKYYYFDLKTGKLLKIEEKFVFLLEGKANGESEASMAEEMANYFSVDVGIASELVDQGLGLLKAGGIIE